VTAEPHRKLTIRGIDSVIDGTLLTVDSSLYERSLAENTEPLHLFDVPTPRVGETTSPTVPIMLVSAGLDAACRVADALRVGRANLTIEAVKRRIQSEIEQHFKNPKEGETPIRAKSIQRTRH